MGRPLPGSDLWPLPAPNLYKSRWGLASGGGGGGGVEGIVSWKAPKGASLHPVLNPGKWLAI